MISVWKWFLVNDFLPQKVIYCCFLLKKIIYLCEKSFTSTLEMINCTRKWFRRSPKMISVEIISVSFDASFEDLICSWEKKHLQRKWWFPEMVGNHFLQGNALQPPKSVRFGKLCDDIKALKVKIVADSKRRNWRSFNDKLVLPRRKRSFMFFSRKRKKSCDNVRFDSWFPI